MAQSVKYLLYMHEDLSLDPYYLCKNLGVMGSAHSSSSGEAEMRMLPKVFWSASLA